MGLIVSGMNYLNSKRNIENNVVRSKLWIDRQLKDRKKWLVKNSIQEYCKQKIKMLVYFKEKKYRNS